MVWGSRPDRMGDLPGLWPLLLCEGLVRSPPKQIPLTVDRGRSGGSRRPLRMDRFSFPA
jgi:hypothetical protein